MLRPLRLFLSLDFLQWERECARGMNTLVLVLGAEHGGFHCLR